MASVLPEAEALLEFWFGELDAEGAPSPETAARWFRRSEGFDAELLRRFGALVEQALAGDLEVWADQPRGRLALVLLLDQLPRNVFRGTARAFAGDARALRLVLSAIEAGEGRALAPIERNFLYMPIMHAEDLVLQDQSVALFTKLAAAARPGIAERLAASRDYAVAHREVIARFGRFPGRNAALGRESTPEERVYLEDDGGF